MPVNLESVRKSGESESEPLKEVERITFKVGETTHTLAVAVRGTEQVLCRVIERGKVGKDGKRSRESGTEESLRPTPRLLDFAYAVAEGLVA